MTSITKGKVTRKKHQAGQSLVEYSFILMLVALAIVALLTTIGNTTANSIVPVNEAMK